MQILGYDIHLLAKQILKKYHGIRTDKRYTECYNDYYSSFVNESQSEKIRCFKEIMEGCVDINIQASKGLITDLDAELLKYDTAINYIACYDIVMEFGID